MEGIRTSFSVLFLFCVWTVFARLSTAHQGHVIVTKQTVVTVPEQKDEHRCMALLRRTVLRKELITYPCFHPVPGVVPVVAHQTQMGLVCRGYTNNPSTQYIRLPTCCPGYQPDVNGRCISSQDKETAPKKESKPKQQVTKRLEDLEEYPASYEKKRQQVLSKVLSQPQVFTPHPAIMRRIETILKHRANFLQHMKDGMSKSSKTQQPMPPATMINGLFPSVPHHLLGHPGHKQSVPQIPRQSHPKQQHSNPHHMQQQSVAQNMPHAFHAALHKHNIPHGHDDKGNPRLHDNNPKQHVTNDAFIKQQHAMQMAARKQLYMKRQQQMYQLQQQRQYAMAMRQRMLHQRRMQQLQRQQQMMMQQARKMAQQSIRQIPFIPRREVYRQSQSVHPFVIQRHYVSRDSLKDFPNVPRVRASVMLSVSPNMMQRVFRHQTVQSFPQIPTQQMHVMRVQLPRNPVETPPVNVRPGPNSPYTGLPPPPPCFVKYLQVVKQCFQEAEITIPDDHSMFNVNYNYNGVCQKREGLMYCVFNNLSPCNTMQEQMLVKSTIAHTVDEMNRFCQIGQINGIEDRLEGKANEIPIIPKETEQVNEEIESQPVQEVPIIPEDHHAMSLGQHTVNVQPAVNEKVPEISVEAEKQPSIPEAPKSDKVQTSKSEDNVDKNIIGTADAHSNDKHDNDHEHGVLQEEIGEEDYYLPILIGTAIGVAGIFFLLLAIVCICCKRRLKKKIYLQKETEKPKLFDVYTIGVPPPVYEVNGIPLISYEEAKGEKFTGSPSSVRRHNAENESEQHEEGRVSGVVSDI